MFAKAHINPKILRWMRERGGLDVGDAAHVVGISPDQLTLWETGESRPTFLQAQKSGSGPARTVWLPVSD